MLEPFSLVVAGSETTGTALSGIMGNLVHNCEDMKRIAEEVRRSFNDASEISAERVSHLPFLNAVIEEGLRLCPPIALGMPRTVPAGGCEVSSQWLPGGVSQEFQLMNR